MIWWFEKKNLIDNSAACGICNNLISMLPPVGFRSWRRLTNASYLRHLSLNHCSANWECWDQVRGGDGPYDRFQLLRLSVFLSSELMSCSKSSDLGRCWAHKVALCAYGQCWSIICTLTHIGVKLNFLPKWQTSTWVSKLAVWLYKNTQKQQNMYSSLLFFLLFSCFSICES